MITARVLPPARALLLLLPVLGCSGDRTLLLPEFDDGAGTFVVERSVQNGIVQTLFLSHAEVAPGDTLRILSVVSNRGHSPVTVGLTDCRIHLRTRMDHEDARPCFADTVSGTRTLGPGQSRSQDAVIVVHAQPGTYRVQVQHLVDPSFWLPFDLRVRG